QIGPAVAGEIDEVALAVPGAAGAEGRDLVLERLPRRAQGSRAGGRDAETEYGARRRGRVDRGPAGERHQLQHAVVVDVDQLPLGAAVAGRDPHRRIEEVVAVLIE